MHISTRVSVLWAALGVLSLAASAAASSEEEKHVDVATEKGPTGQGSIGVTARDGVGITGASVSGRSGNLDGRVDAHTDGSVGVQGGVSGRDGSSAHAGVATDGRGNTSVEGGITVSFP